VLQNLASLNLRQKVTVLPDLVKQGCLAWDTKGVTEIARVWQVMGMRPTYSDCEDRNDLSLPPEVSCPQMHTEIRSSTQIPTTIPDEGFAPQADSRALRTRLPPAAELGVLLKNILTTRSICSVVLKRSCHSSVSITACAKWRKVYQ
jgi:hypothetical protein